MGVGQEGVIASVMWTWPLFEHRLPAYVLSSRANFNHQDINMQLPDKTQETAPKQPVYALFDAGPLAFSAVALRARLQSGQRGVGDEVQGQIVTQLHSRFRQFGQSFEKYVKL